MKESLDHELQDLLGKLCNGLITNDEVHRLDAVLSQEETARQAYNNYMFLHAELFAQHASLEAPQDGQSCEPWTADCGLEAPTASTNTARTKPSPAHSKRQFPWWTLAAMVLGVAAFSSVATYQVLRGLTSTGTVAATNSQSAEQPNTDPTSAESVARITATRNCLWKGSTNGIGYGSHLLPGQRLELAAGLVEITFDDGAAVVLEGPATFDVCNRGQAQLHAGRLSAVVPARAQGFQVATSRVNIIDLGTEFGLMAEPEGTTEVHVFNGLVKAQLLDGAGKQLRTVELNTSEAARIQPAVAEVAKIAARDDEFVRSMSIVAGPHDGLYAYDGFNYPAGPLAEQNGGFGWAGPWFNVEADAKSDANSNGVAASSLEYEGLLPLGNRAVQTAHQNRVRRSLGTSMGGVFDAAGLVENQDGMRLVGRDGTVVYLSFLQRVDKTNDVFYGFELHRSDGNGNRVLCIGHGAENSNYGVTSNFNAYNAENYPQLGQENTETNFFIVRISFGEGNVDRAEVFRNPKSLTDEGACSPDAVLTGNFAFDRISLGNFHGTKIHEIDEIRVGTTFRAVAGRRGRAPDRLTPRVAQNKGQLLDRPWSRAEQHRLIEVEFTKAILSPHPSHSLSLVDR